MTNTFAQRLAEPDMADLADWQAADALNAPDPTLPLVRRAVPTSDAQEILLSSGEWAAVLLAAESAATPQPLRGACINLRDTIRQSSVIRMDVPAIYAATDAVLTGMVGAGLMSAGTRAALLALADRPQSWAEAHGVEVTSRTVGLARGGV
jgi:hypothetical protein